MYVDVAILRVADEGAIADGAVAPPVLAELQIKISGGLRFWLWQKFVWPWLSETKKRALLQAIAGAAQTLADVRFGERQYRLAGIELRTGSLLATISIAAVAGGAYKFVKDYKTLRENVQLMAADIKKGGDLIGKVVARFVSEAPSGQMTGGEGEAERQADGRILPETRPRLVDVEAVGAGLLIDWGITFAVVIFVGLAVSATYGVSMAPEIYETPGFVVLLAAGGVATSAIGGFVTARIAEQAVMLNVLTMAALSAALSLVFYVYAISGDSGASPFQFWTSTVSLALQIPAALIGGGFGVATKPAV